jgi:hypothetical protein
VQAARVADVLTSKAHHFSLSLGWLTGVVLRQPHPYRPAGAELSLGGSPLALSVVYLQVEGVPDAVWPDGQDGTWTSVGWFAK